MINYFKNKSQNDFKNSKKFWSFYSSFIKIKSSKNNQSIDMINVDGKNVSSAKEIANEFNHFFTNFKEDDIPNKFESSKFIFKHFKDMKDKKLITPKIFNFRPTTLSELKSIVSKVNNDTSPGCTEIPIKVLKMNIDVLAQPLLEIINHCIIDNTIPDDWKIAIVTPLYKNKGDKSDMNNYRGISVLSPFAKIFEKIIASQIVQYFNDNNLLYNGQHGFRTGHSCETALHELLSKCLEKFCQTLIKNG